MIRLLGIMLVSASVGIYGFFMSQKVKYTQNLREDILGLLKALERDIKYGNRAISEILSGFKTETCDLHDMIEKIINGSNVSTAINTHLSSLSETEREKIKNLLMSIGKSRCSEEELILCKNCIDFFAENNSTTKKNADARSGLYAKLGLIGGILTIIILI